VKADGQVAGTKTLRRLVDYFSVGNRGNRGNRGKPGTDGMFSRRVAQTLAAKLTWGAAPFGFKGAVFDFVFLLFVSRSQTPFNPP